MKENWSKAFAAILASEGGYVNDPDDRGGETNLGVTRKAWQDWLGRPVKDGEIAALKDFMVEPFYRSNYWDKCRCDRLPAGLDYAVFDFAINAGTTTAACLLQRAVGVPEDGKIGPVTLSAIQKHDIRDLLNLFAQKKADYYDKIVLNRPDQGKFLRGWKNRIAAVQHIASSMV